MKSATIALFLLATAAAPAKADYEYVEESLTNDDFMYVYFVSDTSLNWHMAKKDCLQRGLKLASIMSTEENELLKKVLSQLPKDTFWISLSDLGSPGTWYWDSNGAPLSFSNWYPNEPDKIGSEQCTYLTPEASSLRRWNNRDCQTYIVKYVCEGFLPRS